MGLKDLDHMHSDWLQGEEKGRQIAQQISNGQYWVPGQRVVVSGTKLIVINHLEIDRPGFYMAIPDVDVKDVKEPVLFTPVIVYHPETARWAQSLLDDPEKILGDLVKAALAMASK